MVLSGRTEPVKCLKHRFYGREMSTAVVFFQGVFEIVGFGGFIIGYFMAIPWLMIVAGCLVILDDIIQIAMHILNPLFPVLLAIGLAIVFTPWYVGVFWASAVFKVLGIPASLMKIFRPRRFFEKALERNAQI